MNSSVRPRLRPVFGLGAVVLALTFAGGASAMRPTGREYPSVGDNALPPADPRTVPGYGHHPLSLLGASRLSAQQLAAFVAAEHTPRTTVSIDRLAQIYIEEGAAWGVRADLAWTQAIVETGWFTYPDGGLVKPHNNNFAGMGACDSCSDGNHYADARTGVRAQMQQLRGYADPNGLPNPINKPPDSYLGSAPTWFEMGNGHWATSTRYSTTIIGIYSRMLDHYGVSLDFEAPSPFSRAADPVVEARLGDGLYLAGIDGMIYDVGDARFWGAPLGGDLRNPIAAVVPTPTAEGYWVITNRGRVFRYGDAVLRGAKPAPIRSVVASAAATPRGVGFWMVSRTGEVRAFGDAAAIEPAPGAIAPDARVVGIAPTATGLGYWIVDSAGRVVAVGDAAEFGSLAAPIPTDPVVGIAATPAGDGFWLATSRGRVHRFGAAKRFGGLFQEFDAQLNVNDFETFAAMRAEARRRVGEHPVIAIASTPTGGGYWLVSADGSIIGRGDAADFGDATPPGEAIVFAVSRRL
jgi:Mannosyl-glycoprotein endo-beta-N-acetylglucosaminidase